MPSPKIAEGAVISTPSAAETAQGDVLADAYNALVRLGHSPADARDMLDKAIASGKTFNEVEEVLLLIYSRR